MLRIENKVKKKNDNKKKQRPITRNSFFKNIRSPDEFFNFDVNGKFS